MYGIAANFGCSEKERLGAGAPGLESTDRAYSAPAIRPPPTPPLGTLLGDSPTRRQPQGGGRGWVFNPGMGSALLHRYPTRMGSAPQEGFFKSGPAIDFKPDGCSTTWQRPTLTR